MGKLLRCLMAVILTVVLLLGVPGLAGCGTGTDVETTEIVIGLLTDFTGPASYAVKPTMDSFKDVFRWAAANDPISGVRVKFINYDQRTDPARVPPGYMWLKGQGADLLYIISPTDRAILADDFTKDRIPVVGASIDEGAPNHPWSFACYGSNGHEAEAGLQWIMETWDYEGKGRNPVIGHFSWTHPSGRFHQVGIDRMLQWFPDKFDWAGEQAPPLGSTTFAGELAQLRKCDYIWITPAGAMIAGFIKEARNRGYTGAFLGGSNSFSGYWDLVTAAVPAGDLYDSYLFYWTPWWNEEVPNIVTAKEATYKYHPRDAERRFTSQGPAGWAMGTFTLDAIRRAVDAVGAANVDGSAIRDALVATNMDVKGYGNVWRFESDYHTILRTIKVYQWDVDRKDWLDAGAGWITPKSLAK